MAYNVIGADGREYGPVEMSMIQQWAREGRIQANTIITDLQTGAQYAANQIPELIPLLPFQPINPGGYTGYAPQWQTYSPLAPPTKSTKSKLVAGLLGLFFGGFGVHRFYLGYTTIGILQIVVTILTCGFGGIWGFVEGIMCLTGNIPDAEGRPLDD
jgi:hypothetical protein